MKGKLKVDDKNKRLVMEHRFDIARRIVGSPEYYLLQMAKQDNPTYDVVVKRIKKNPEKQIYKHLTYDYMREYVRRHPHAKEREAELEEMILRAKCHIEMYANVKSWFLAAYPDISDFTPMQFKEEHENDNPVVDFCEVVEAATCNPNPLPLAS